MKSRTFPYLFVPPLSPPNARKSLENKLLKRRDFTDLGRNIKSYIPCIKLFTIIIEVDRLWSSVTAGEREREE
jgi:hypothetical protein